MLKNKQIIITGGTGYIGKNLIPILLKEKCRITVLARDIDKIRHFRWFKKIDCIKFNFKKYKLNYRTLKKNSTLVHLAWEGLPNYHSNIHLKKNINSHYLFIKKLIKKKIIKNLIVAGTSQEYGMQYGIQKVTSKTNPTTSYAKAKVKLYKKILLLRKYHSFKFKWMRLYYSYGKWQNKSSVFSQLSYAISNKKKYFKMSKGDQVRDYMPISKMITKIIEVIAKKEEGIFNICSGNGVRLKDLIIKIIKLKKSKIKLKLGYFPYLSYEPKYFWGESSI